MHSIYSYAIENYAIERVVPSSTNASDAMWGKNRSLVPGRNERELITDEDAHDSDKTHVAQQTLRPWDSMESITKTATPQAFQSAEDFP